MKRDKNNGRILPEINGSSVIKVLSKTHPMSTKEIRLASKSNCQQRGMSKLLFRLVGAEVIQRLSINGKNKWLLLPDGKAKLETLEWWKPYETHTNTEDTLD